MIVPVGYSGPDPQQQQAIVVVPPPAPDPANEPSFPWEFAGALVAALAVVAAAYLRRGR